MKYIVVSFSDLNFFTQRVNDKIKEGYVLIGGICITISTTNGFTLYAQAMALITDKQLLT